ncbi:MAG: DinB family protein [Candidatus Sulfotelmatobacter sp.]
MKRIISAFCLFFLTVASIHVTAQGHPYRDGTPRVTGYRSEVLALVMIQGDEFTRLAEAIPAEKYSWRPAPGVRSVAEVLLHASAANYNMYKLVGAKIPQRIETNSMEQSTTDKVRVIATLKESYAHAKQAITDMPDADLEKSMDWSGGRITERGVLLFIVPHIAEHLGQLIAYARVLGVVPPWTADEQKKQAEKKEDPKEKR